MGILETINMLEREEAIEEAKAQVVKNMLLTKRFSVAEISIYTGIPKAFVRKQEKALK